MTYIYFIRHGQGEGNVAKEFHGNYNSNLTELGHKQAELAGEFLKDKKIEKVYSSDLLRTYNTALHIANKCNLTVIKDSNLREIRAGKWERMKFTDIEIQFPDDFNCWQNNLSECRCTDGESIKELYKRINSEVDKIARENDEKTICIVTHATPLRVLKCNWCKTSIQNIQSIPFAPNASVSMVKYFENGKKEILLDAECKFMGNLVTNLPKNL